MGLADIKSSLDIMIAQVMKASSSMTGLDLSVSGIINRLNNLHSSFLNLSITTGTSGKSMEALESRIMSMSSAFGYTQENMAKMQQTLMVGFREPIRDAETFNALLVKSQSLFGSNEESAQQFINSLAALSNKNTGLRDSMLELMVLQGKSAQSGQSLNAGEIKQKELLKNYNKEQLSFMLLTGDISKEQFNTNMKLMQETSVSADAYEARYTRMQTVLQSMKAPGIAGTAALNDLSQNEMLSAGIGKVMTFGADVVAESIDKLRGLKRARDHQQTQPDLGTEESKLAVDVAMEQIKGLGINDPALIEKSAKLEWERLGYTKDQVEALSKSAEFQKSMGNELGTNMARQSQINKLVEGTLSIEEQRNIVMQEQAGIMEQLRMNASNYGNAISLSLGASETMAAALGRAGMAFDAKKVGLDLEGVIKNAQAQVKVNDELADSYEAQATIVKGLQAALAEGDNTGVAKRVDTLIEAKTLRMETLQTLISSSSDKNVQASAQQMLTKEEENMAGLIRMKAGQTSIEDNAKILRSEDAASEMNLARAQEARVQGIKNMDDAMKKSSAVAVAAENEHLRILQAKNSVLESEVALMDSLAVGIGANAAAREKVALNIMQQAKLEEEKIKNLQANKAAFEKLLTSEDTSEENKIKALGALNGIDMQMNEATAKRNQLQKNALDQLQKLREGYLDSIDAMQSGAGIFTELIVSQDKSLGALIRTTQEVPRVLRTGAGSGGITSATQFGPGGLSGSFDPKSEEYSKHVLTNISQINDLVSSLPEQIGKSVGTNLALAAKGRSEYDGQIMGAASPGTSGVISSSSPSSIVGSNAATSLAAGTAPVATQVAVATKQAEEATTRAVGTAPDVVIAKAEEALATKAADTAAKALEKATKALGAAEEAAAKAAAEAEAEANSAEAVATRAATSAGTASELGAALIAAEAAANKATEAAAAKVAVAAAAKAAVVVATTAAAEAEAEAVAANKAAAEATARAAAPAPVVAPAAGTTPAPAAGTAPAPAPAVAPVEVVTAKAAEARAAEATAKAAAAAVVLATTAATKAAAEAVAATKAAEAANKAAEVATVKVAEAAATAATAGTAGTAGTALAALTALAAAEAEVANKAAASAAAKATEVATAKAAVAVATTVATNATAEAEAANKAAAAATKAAEEATARAVGAAGPPVAPAPAPAPAPAAPVGNKATVEAAAEVAVATKQAAEATTKAVGAAPVAAPPPAPAILTAPDVVIAKAEEALATKAADTAAKALEKATKALGAAEEAAAEAEAVANSAVAVATRAATSAGTASGLGAALIAATVAAAAEAEAAAKATEVATAKEVVAAKAAEVVAAKAAEVVTAKEVVAAKTTTEAATRAAEAAAVNKAVVASGDTSYNQQQRMQAGEKAAEAVATNAAGASVPFQSSTINGVTVSTSEMVSQISKIIQDGMIQAVQIGTRSAIAELSNAAASSR